MRATEERTPIAAITTAAGIRTGAVTGKARAAISAKSDVAGIMAPVIVKSCTGNESRASAASCLVASPLNASDNFC